MPVLSCIPKEKKVTWNLNRRVWWLCHTNSCIHVVMQGSYRIIEMFVDEIEYYIWYKRASCCIYHVMLDRFSKPLWCRPSRISKYCEAFIIFSWNNQPIILLGDITTKTINFGLCTGDATAKWGFSMRKICLFINPPCWKYAYLENHIFPIWISPLSQS